MKRPAGLYIHVPFCRSKCPYCDFVSGPASEETVARYMRSLKKELRYWSSEMGMKGVVFQSLYVGGGTPTAVAPEILSEILFEAFELFDWVDQAEATVEANPESVDKRGLEMFKKAGVNRISLGMQALSEKGLRVLGRLHDVNSSVRAFEIVRDLGFGSVSVDLIYGWPGQEISSWKKELESVISLGPDHISCYELTVERGTRLHKDLSRGRIALPEEDIILKMMDVTETELKAAGYVHYEISNYALPGKECVHNLGYWTAKPYVGVGVSAASFLPPLRMKQVDDLNSYIRNIESGNISPEFVEVLSRDKLFREAVVFGLRKVEGIDTGKMKQTWGDDPVEYYGDELKKLIDSGLMKFSSAGKSMLRLTKRGRRVSNFVFAQLV